MKRLFVALHLYLGLILSLFFASWFLTGIVMLYFTWPDFRQVERQALAEPIPWDKLRLSPAQAAAKGGWDRQPLKQARVAALLGRPVFRAWPQKGSWRAAYLDDGSPVALSEAEALRVAEATAPGNWKAVPFEWENSSRQAGYAGGLKAYDKVHYFKAGDGSGRSQAVSVATGEPLFVSGRFFPIAFVFGPGLHYFMIKAIRGHDGFWHDFMHVSAALATFCVLFGLIIGVWNFHWKSGGSPYKAFWMWTHHLLGLIFGLFALTWAVSGFFSFAPRGWFPPNNLTAPQAGAFLKSAQTAAEMKGLKPLPGAREVDLRVFEGQLHARVWDGSPHSRRVPEPRLDRAAVERAVARVFPESRLLALDLLDEGDAYYYQRPEKRRWRVLPIYRAELENPSRTLYLDPNNGETFYSFTLGSRFKRWIYHGLHSFDFQPLIKRPLWDLWMIFFLTAGLALSVTGVVLTWNWLKKKFIPS